MNESIDVALVIPLHGSAGIFGPSCEFCAQLAVAEINAADGVLGRELRLSVIDGAASPDQVADEVGALSAAGLVDAVVGWHISAVRQAVVPRVAGRVPYVYTALYEGGERTPGVFLTGETPSHQLLPAMQWLRREHGVRRWSIVGNDYVWPRATARAAREFARMCDGQICHEAFVPLGWSAWSGVVEDVSRARPDAVIMLLVGADAVTFNRAFAAAGLDVRCRRLSTLIDENTLAGSGAKSTRGHLRRGRLLRNAGHAREPPVRAALHAAVTAPTRRRSTASASPATRGSCCSPRSRGVRAAWMCAG